MINKKERHVTSKKSVSFKIRIIPLTLVLIIIAMSAAGCSNNASSAEEPGTSPVDAPSPSHTPIATTEPIKTDEPDLVEEEQDYMAVLHDGWIYYLDVNDPIVVEYSEDPLLHRKLEDESGDVSLDIRGFNYDIIGEYIYIDSNDIDLDETGIQTWSTTRLNLDGTNRKRLEYGSMSARLVPEGDQKFYFTTLGDLAVYVSDFSCENVLTLNINLPDKSELDEKLGTDNVLQMTISSIANSLIEFEVAISAENGTIIYSGSYKTTLVGTSTEKISGTYYEYGSQENE